jgi:hypothetical protein
VAGGALQPVLEPLAADPIAAGQLEPGCGDGRLHGRLVHAGGGVAQPLDHQRPVARRQPVGGEDRVQDHATAGSQHPGALAEAAPAVGQARQHVPAPHQVAGAVGDREGLQVALDQVDPTAQAGRGGLGQPAGQPGADQVDAHHPAAVAPGQRHRRGGVAAAGVQGQLTGAQAQPAGGVQQQLRRPWRQAPAQQLLGARRPALAGEQLGERPPGQRVGHVGNRGSAGGPGRADFRPAPGVPPPGLPGVAGARW